MSLPQHPRAVVTGGGGGLGRALCIELAKRGARILVADVRKDTAEETAILARDAGARDVFAMGVDVAKSDEVEKLAAEAESRFGGTDLLVNNAGVATAGITGEVPLTDWEWIVGINLWGVVYGCHHFVPKMKERRAGHILNVASAAGLLCAPQMGPYNVTKAAVVALSETLYAELGPLDIGVTVLCPMFFKTGIIENSRLSNQQDRALGQRLLDREKLSAEDVARKALESVEKKHLYAVPMANGRWLWRMKRTAPETFHWASGGILTKVKQRFSRVTK
ncbi:SDR family NAD(P)-dependent oxidoreductase [Pendulispora rubella]|uniref:SDR family NAD(P)-dependent oxidoreductase n=1 Tax=Pendulispora rubella TaxID=2741070 RepID=A0ABZ2LFW9_9BACT